MREIRSSGSVEGVASNRDPYSDYLWIRSREMKSLRITGRYQVAAPNESSTPKLHRATIAQQRVRMEGWRQERLGSRAGTHREEEKNKNILTRNEKKERKTYLTLTGPLMEGH